MLTALAALVSSGLLAALWNVLGWAPRTLAGYELTQSLAPATWGFAAAYAVIAGLLGWITRRPWPVALGMILIRPIACSVEIAQDPTSHNLIPFEILMFWLPLLLLAFACASVGRVFRARADMVRASER